MPKSADQWFREGNAFMRKNNLEGALEAYNKAIEIKPNHADYWNNKGNVLAKKGDFKAALIAYDEAIKLEPNDAAIWHNKGLAFEENGELEAALNAYNKAIKLNANLDVAWNSRGNILWEQNEFESALEAFNKAVKLKPRDADYWHNKGIALYEINEFEGAIKAFDKAIRFNSDLTEAWRNKEIAIRSKNKFEKRFNNTDGLKQAETPEKPIKKRRKLAQEKESVNKKFKLPTQPSEKLSNNINNQELMIGISNNNANSISDNKEKTFDDESHLQSSNPSSILLSAPCVSTTQIERERQLMIIEKKFLPIIEPEKLNYAIVKFFKSKLKQKPRSVKLPVTLLSAQKQIYPKQAETQEKLTDEAKMKIGRWGEHCVYQKLKQHYEKKYCGKAREATNGFNLEGVDSSNNKVNIEVTWYNKTNESYNNIDLMVVKNKIGAVKEQYIEVKTTTSDKVHKASFPASEWQAMLIYKEKYNIYRVFNAGQSENVRIEKIKNPLEKILQGELEIESMQLKI